MGQSTEELNEDIEATRQRLTRDVDELSDKVSPSQMAQRQKDAARGKLTALRDRVMGSVEDARDTVASAGGSAGDHASGAMHEVRRKTQGTTQGNPLAAGVLAFSIGMLISSLIPASDAEQRVAREARDRAAPVLDEARSMGQEMGEHLKDAGQEAAQQVGSAAKESAEQLKDEGQSSAEQVKGAAGS